LVGSYMGPSQPMILRKRALRILPCVPGIQAGLSANRKQIEFF
jgi:hypothetical protein